MDTKELMEEIRDIYLDPVELHCRFEESIDEDGLHVWREYESSKKQDLLVEQVILRFQKAVVEDTYKKVMGMLDR